MYHSEASWSIIHLYLPSAHPRIFKFTEKKKCHEWNSGEISLLTTGRCIRQSIRMKLPSHPSKHNGLWQTAREKSPVLYCCICLVNIYLFMELDEASLSWSNAKENRKLASLTDNLNPYLGWENWHFHNVFGRKANIPSHNGFSLLI